MDRLGPWEPVPILVTMSGGGAVDHDFFQSTITSVQSLLGEVGPVDGVDGEVRAIVVKVRSSFPVAYDEFVELENMLFVDTPGRTSPPRGNHRLDRAPNSGPVTKPN
jgi:hypothetical protein